MKNLKKKAEMGMGTLIIFIAMILVAAIAASVLITTTSSLQSKALTTGMATKNEIGTSLSVIQMYGEDGSTGNFNGYAAYVQLSPGSEPIKLSDLLVTLTLKNASEDLTYSSTETCSNLTNVTAGKFGVVYAKSASSGHMAGYLVAGDIGEFCLPSPRSVAPGEHFILTFVPKVGMPATISGYMPSIINQVREQIFP